MGQLAEADETIGHEAWHTLTPGDVARRLGSDTDSGLDAAEVARRAERFGPNRLEDTERAPRWKLFVSQFQDFMIYVLFAAVLISVFEGQTAEAVAILAILLLNGVLGFVQEARAEDALAALKDLSAPTATVLRGGSEAEVRADELVPGDVVLLEAGDRVPADGRLVETAALRVVESSLTGESEPVPKSAESVAAADAALGDRRGMVFASTSVAVGRGRFVVTSTGQATEVGRIADLLSETVDEATPLEEELESVGKRIASIVLAVALVVFAEEVFLATRNETGTFAEMFTHPEFRQNLTGGLLIAVSLAVAAIPEGLPAIVTVSLSLGVKRMAQRNALVRRLHAVETLGSTTFICSDKTGTLTLNRMSVRRMIVGRDEAEVEADWSIEPAERSPHPADLARLMLIAHACNDAHHTAAGELVGDPTETALVVASAHLAPGGINPRRLAEIPFDSERKRMTTVHRLDDEVWAFTKGGADVVLGLCSHALLRGEVTELDAKTRASLSEANERLAASGFRTLAFAQRRLAEVRSDDDVESGLTYVGVLGLVDPARPEVPDAVRACRDAGIRVAMVTGDHALTASAIAREVGILDGDGTVLTGADLQRLDDDELARQVTSVRVFARVDPEHKIRIVSALKRNGHVVAMTGDGVNDAPALKRADIGVAMGVVGTDVAREASDMVLADDNFATIVSAVGEGRAVFDNLRKVILFLLSCNMSEVLVVAVTALFSPQVALLPLQILWINLVTDGLPALALGIDPPADDVMRRGPRDADESILNRSTQLEIVWQGAVMTGAVLVLGYVVAPSLGASAEQSQTMLFTALVLTQLLHALNFRSEHATVFSAASLKNGWLLGALAGSMLLQILVIYTPAAQSLFDTAALTASDWVGVVVASLLAAAVMDAPKLFGRRRPEEGA